MAEKKLKEHIVSFRIPKEKAEVVAKMLKEQPVIGIKSVSQWFRKLGMDRLAGRLAYKNPEDMMMDLDA